MARRQYNYTEPEDGVSIKWMKKQAARSGKSYAKWSRDAGMMSEWDEKKANREIPESVIGARAMNGLDNRLSIQAYNDGTSEGGSIILDSRSYNKKRAKRKRFVEDQG